MQKPGPTSTVTQMKDYIRSKQLNKPEIKLSMKKADLIAGLKMHGHWQDGKKQTTVSKAAFSTARKGLIKTLNKPNTKPAVKKTDKAIEKDNLKKGYIGGGSQMGRVNTSKGLPTKDMTGAKVPAQTVKQIREDMKKIKSKSGHVDIPAKPAVKAKKSTQSTDTMVGYNPFDKKEVDEAKTKLAPSIYRNFMSELDAAVKSQGLANAKKQSKDKTKYMLFLNAGNVTAKSLNDKVNLINVLYREDKVSEAQMGELTRKFRRFNTTRRAVQALTKGIYDNMDDFIFHQSKAGVNLTSTRN